MLALSLLAVALFVPIDRRHYSEQDFYKTTIQAINQTDWTTSAATDVWAGWARRPIVPAVAAPMAGYGISRGDFQGIHDSVYVQAVVWQSGGQWYALVSADLLVFPPAVADELYINVQTQTGIAFKNLLLTATHTHSSIGGWADRIAGRLMAGGYRREIVEMITAQVIAALKAAQANAKPLASIGFGKTNAPELMSNRLSKKPKATIDGYLRCIRLLRSDSNSALIAAYQAHAICVHPRLHDLSRDYPGYFTDSLEQSGKVNFALFGSGMVASHVPNYNWGLDSYDLARDLGKKLAARSIRLLDSISADTLRTISAWQIPISVGEPQLRITDDIIIRPAVFKWLFGEQRLYLSIMRLDRILLIGVPCDISGEFAAELMEKAAAKNLQLVVTSFNGGYIGYITPDEYYGQYAPEVREMNWVGPHRGAFFQELLSRIIEKQNSN
ncbi:neutral/alkaline non-lysosomal ceramidase N-terminal domain-containing protein [Rhodoflexus sp.]